MDTVASDSLPCHWEEILVWICEVEQSKKKKKKVGG